jgi:hypothetical protein
VGFLFWVFVTFENIKISPCLPAGRLTPLPSGPEALWAGGQRGGRERENFAKEGNRGAKITQILEGEFKQLNRYYSLVLILGGTVFSARLHRNNLKKCLLYGNFILYNYHILKCYPIIRRSR